MNHRMVARILGQVLLIFAALMLLPLIAGLCFGENVAGFAAAILIGALVIPIVELVKAAQRLAARSRASETETA